MLAMNCSRIIHGPGIIHNQFKPIGGSLLATYKENEESLSPL